MASSTSWRWPCASWPTMRWAIDGDADALERLVGAPLGDAAGAALVAAVQTFSRAVKPVEHVGTWVLMPTPRRAIACVAMPVTGAPRNRIWPLGRPELAGQAFEEGALARAVRADHAAQLASCRVKSTWSTATTPPKRIVRPWSRGAASLSWIGLRRSAVGRRRGRRARPVARPASHRQASATRAVRPLGTSRTKITSRTPSTRLGSTQPKPLTWLSVPS